jgi:lipopolysaccharide/colanic/teichoic acid biosynthesis glycosyltransferase
MTQLAGAEPAIAGFSGPVLVEVRPLRASPQPHAFYDLTKRLVDLVLGLVLSLLALPIILLAAAVLACELRANPFFLQTRVGFLRRRFTMLKLRTMRPGTEHLVPVELNETGGLAFKSRRDPRVTRLGNLMRRTSLDELPQLLNVVAGQMSLVGRGLPFRARSSTTRPPRPSASPSSPASRASGR